MNTKINLTSTSTLAAKSFHDVETTKAPEFLSASKAPNSSVASLKDGMMGSDRVITNQILQLQAYVAHRMNNQNAEVPLSNPYVHRGQNHQVYFKTENGKLSFYCPTLERPFVSPNIMSLRVERDPPYGHGLAPTSPFVGQLLQMARESLAPQYGPFESPNPAVSAASHFAPIANDLPPPYVEPLLPSYSTAAAALAPQGTHASNDPNLAAVVPPRGLPVLAARPGIHAEPNAASGNAGEWL